MIEEYGLAINAAQGIADEAARDTGYRTWTDTVLAHGGAGDQFWLLTSRVDDGSFYPDYDGYRIIWDNEPEQQHERGGPAAQRARQGHGRGQLTPPAPQPACGGPASRANTPTPNGASVTVSLTGDAVQAAEL